MQRSFNIYDQNIEFSNTNLKMALHSFYNIQFRRYMASEVELRDSTFIIIGRDLNVFFVIRRGYYDILYGFYESFCFTMQVPHFRHVCF